MDKTLAKKTDKLLFVKVENDGFSLGSQRKELSTSDLPDTANLIKHYTSGLRNDDLSLIDLDKLPLNALLVEKSKIKEGGDYNLSADRYRINTARHKGKYDFVELSEVSNIQKGSAITKKDAIEGDIPVIAGGQQPAYYHNAANRKGKVITVSASGAYAGFINYFTHPIFASDCTTIEAKDENEVNTKFLYHLLKSRQEDFYKFQIGGGQPHVYATHFANLKIPLPPLAIQQEIVVKIEQYEKIISGGKQVVEAYNPQIDIHPEWEMVELASVCEINPKKSEILNREGDLMVSFVPMADLNENSYEFFPKEERNINNVYNGYTYFKDSDVLLAKVTPCFENGKAGIAKNLRNGIGFGSSEFVVLRSGENVLPLWLYLNVTSPRFRELGKARMTGTGGLQRVPKDFIESYLIPLPSIEVQQEAISKIENEQQLVNCNKDLVQLFEKKIKDEINKLWEE